MTHSDVLIVGAGPTDGTLRHSSQSAERTLAEFNIYYNPSPNGDWSKPDTFSGGNPFPGQPVATFARPESLLLNGVIGKHVVTGYLVASRAFTFNGHRYDFNAIVPAGLTLNETAGSTPDVPGVQDFPVGLAFAGNCLSVGSDEQNEQ
jgi:hypothetical protein